MKGDNKITTQSSGFSRGYSGKANGAATEVANRFYFSSETESKFVVEDKIDVVMVKFEKFMEAFQTALKDGIGNLADSCRRKPNNLFDDFKNVVIKRLPDDIEYVMREGEEYSVLRSKPTLSQIEEGLKDFHDDLKAKYGDIVSFKPESTIDYAYEHHYRFYEDFNRPYNLLKVDKVD